MSTDLDERLNAPLAAVFVDFEGTLNDAVASGRLYARGLISWMRGKHAAEPAVWVAALMKAMEGVYRQQLAAVVADPGTWPGYAEYRRRELIVWAQTLLSQAGFEAPAEAEALALARRLEEDIPAEMAPLPGAIEMVRALAGRGWKLFIASGAPSTYTRQCLESGGVLGLFDQVYGPDVVDTLKQGPEFYRRAFRASGFDPARCAVVDDSPDPLAWALEAGARAAVAVGKAAETPVAPGKLPITRTLRLAEVPTILEQWRP